MADEQRRAGHKQPDRVYLSELAVLVDRRENTIRIWERDGILPKKLVPKRDARRWRYWTPAQAEQFKEWVAKRGTYPGKGLRNFNPSEDKVREMFDKLREPRRTTPKRSRAQRR